MKNFEISQLEIDALIKNSPDIIYRLDSNGRIIFINDAVKEYGYLPEELINTDMLELVHPEDRERASCRVKERRTGKRKTISFEVRLLTKWNSSIPFELKHKEIEDFVPFLLNAEGIYRTQTPKQDSYTGTQGIARDISNRKQIEKKTKSK